MPYRTTPLVANEVYHVFNRGVNKQQIFWDERDYSRLMDSLIYYSFVNPPVRYSFLNRLLPEQKSQILEKLYTKHERLIDIIAFVFMPNHYHILVKQLHDHGTSKFLSDWQNSFSRYINTRHDRIGPLFQGQFKAVRVSSNAQLLHVSRYIHLNPFTSGIVSILDELPDFPWSSFPDYVGQSNNSFVCKEIVLGQFKNDPEKYKAFVFDQADYQRSLKRIKDLAID